MYPIFRIALWTTFIICAICLLAMGGLHIAGGYADLVKRLSDVAGASFAVWVGFLIVSLTGIGDK